ncbi:MAG: SDR family NAD(P)-dependent oxidoreductase [Anaerolineae bacterium]
MCPACSTAPSAPPAPSRRWPGACGGSPAAGAAACTARARPTPEPAATALGRRATPNPPPARDLAGRAIVVTGATAGIGLATADALLARGAHVIAIARSPERCRAAAQALLARWPGSRVDVVVADLSSQAEVRRAAAEVRALLPAGRLDALINNAGAVAAWFTPTIDGYELQFALNHLAAFLLTHELLPLLAAAPAGRVVAVSSRSHRWGRIHWADPMLRQNYDILRAYGQSKLANALFTAELNRRLGPASRVQALRRRPRPGGYRHRPQAQRGPRRLVWRLRRRGGQPPDAPARTSSFWPPTPAADLARGWYWRDGQPLAPSRRARSADQAARLWALSARLCGLPDNAPIR